mmetsp:Transcript_20405/g.39432  ORF Transcript_20405/g.39432 Transcript_20405/m.39432 type:complete len:265 (-) Transcript_20405:124-918(-)
MPTTCNCTRTAEIDAARDAFLCSQGRLMKLTELPLILLATHKLWERSDVDDFDVALGPVVFFELQFVLGFRFPLVGNLDDFRPVESRRPGVDREAPFTRLENPAFVERILVEVRKRDELRRFQLFMLALFHRLLRVCIDDVVTIARRWQVVVYQVQHPEILGCACGHLGPVREDTTRSGMRPDVRVVLIDLLDAMFDVSHHILETRLRKGHLVGCIFDSLHVSFYKPSVVGLLLSGEPFAELLAFVKVSILNEPLLMEFTQVSL